MIPPMCAKRVTVEKRKADRYVVTAENARYLAQFTVSQMQLETIGDDIRRLLTSEQNHD
jgi:hypothetical protein